jgi:pyrimidine-nucleoside phosphorylase
MVEIGRKANRKMVALLSNMNQPLGHAIGNALELQEALATLRGDNPPVDFWEHCLEVAGHMLLLAGSAETLHDAKQRATQVRDNGKALAKFRAMVAAQGGDVGQIDDPTTLPAAKLIEPVTAPQSGYIAEIDTTAIGWATVELGAGRHQKGDSIDYAVGFVMPAKVGMAFEAGDTICTIYANDTARADDAHDAIQAAITWSDEPVASLPHFYGTIS